MLAQFANQSLRSGVEFMKKQIFASALMVTLLGVFFTAPPSGAAETTPVVETADAVSSPPSSPPSSTTMPATSQPAAPASSSPAPNVSQPSTAPETTAPVTAVPVTAAPGGSAEPAEPVPTPVASEPAAPVPSAVPVTKAPVVTAEPTVPAAPASSKPAEPKPLVAPETKSAEASAAIAVTGVFKTRWNSLGGDKGALGAPRAKQVSNSVYSYQEFTGGFIFNSSKYGVHHIIKSSAIGQLWYAGGKTASAGFGYAISENISSADGTYQKFSNSKWIFTTKFSVKLNGAVGSKWVSKGGIKAMGAPVGAEVCGTRDGGCYQVFRKGTIFWSARSGSHVSHGGILSRYKANGALGGRYGYPTGAETCGLVQNGCYQNFQNGLILWSPSTGAHGVLAGAIRTHYGRTGTANGFLVYPTSEEICGQRGSGCYQNYKGGTSYWSPASGTSSIHKGKLSDGYARRGGISGSLGYPMAQQVCGQPNGGCYQVFQGGRLWASYGHPRAYKTSGGISVSYTAKGGPRSFLGYPISDEKCSGGQCAQTFVGGYVGWGWGAQGYYHMSECQNLNNGKSRYGAGGSKHVLLTFTQTYRQSYATNTYCKNVAGTYVTEWRTDGYVGAAGFKGPGEASGPTRNLFSPAGSFTVSEAFGLSNPGTALPYRTLNPRSRWGGNPYTSTYNKYFESDSWVGYDENMWYFATRAAHDYEQGVVIDYNRPNIVQDAGFAIFLHQNKVPTAGCISLDNWAVVDYVRKSVPGDRVIMGVKSAIFR